MSVPGGLVFADTHILIYAHGVGDQNPRARIARQRVGELWRDGTGIASSQVLQEFYAVATDPELIVAASVLEERHTLTSGTR